ncbi:lipoprotein [Mycobacterium phage Firecracker]|uniref:Band-7-like membrane protein n=1 Tax=Mycobacterium phage Firecracker TaxID=2922998 RepID=G8I467_9CAUD|nr:lipoprotein [Mycobacterium phage Firecracker]AER47511.1 hypothetical protein FIRECRACKER_85 [Mycobacterium phage Firecracker]
MKRTPLVVVTALAAAGLTACAHIGPGQQAVGKDSWGAPTVSKCAVEESMVSDIGTDWYRFPARAITWDANNDPGAERGPYTALSKPASTPPKAGDKPDPNFSTGQAEMAIPVTITFDMTTNCDDLKEFFRQYATQDGGWLDGDGNPTEGWEKLLTRVISQPAEQAVIVVTQKYPWQRIWNDDVIRSEYVKTLSEQLPKQTAMRTGGKEYFNNFVVQVGKPYPTNEQLRANAEQIQVNQAAAEAERIRLTSEAKAKEEAAKAEEAAATQQRLTELKKAEVRQAEIAGYGTGPEAVDAYLRDKCRQTPDCHQYDPSPIIAGAR